MDVLVNNVSITVDKTVRRMTVVPDPLGHVCVQCFSWAGFASLGPHEIPGSGGRPRRTRCPAGERDEPLAVLDSPRFQDKGPRQVWAILIDEGVYLASVSTMYRLPSEAGQVRERRAQAADPARKKPELIAAGPDEVWSRDITKLAGPQRGVYHHLHVWNSIPEVAAMVKIQPSVRPARQDIVAVAREQVLGRGEPLTEAQLVEVLQTPDGRLDELLALAHEVRMTWCGPEVEVEGIVSLKTGGCPEDCHFCAQSGQFSSPVRSVWLNIPELVEAARQTRATGATEFCIVAAVRGPDERLMAQLREGVKAIREAVDIQIAASLGILTRRQAGELAGLGVHRYNHNLETARSYFPQVVTTHSWEERWDTCLLVKESGMELCCGALVGMGETTRQRAELAAQLGELGPYEVPLNFLNPRPGTPFGDLPVMAARDALRTTAAFRLALPRTVLRYAGGRELTLGDLGTRDGLLGGINAVIVGNYLTTLGRDPKEDLVLLADLQMPIKALNAAL